MESLIIHDRKFRLYLTAEQIGAAVSQLADKINSDLKDKEVVFLIILNGAVIFAADLLKKIRFHCRISFVKLASYEGMKSSGQIRELLGINEVLRNKTVVIVEDIVDSGATLEEVTASVKEYQPSEIRTVTLLFKPNAFESMLKPDYIGMKIPNDFVVGYGLDYDGFGRNLNAIYSVIET